MNSCPVKLSVIIPVYNEEEHILESLSKVLLEVEACGCDFEIIVVDDGSTDKTWGLLCQMLTTTRLRCFRLSRNFGKERAMCAGIDQAKGQAIVFLDADLQHPPELIKEMFEVWKTNDIEIVEAIKKLRVDPSWPRKILANGYHWLFTKLTGYNLKHASDFKLVDKKVLEAWALLPEKNIFLRGLSEWVGFRKKQIYFEVGERQAGESRYDYSKLLDLSIKSICSFSSLPLYIIPFFGIFFLVFAFILSTNTLLQWFRGYAAIGFATIILLQLLIGGLILIALGIIGIYIANIFDESKARPRYIIAENKDGKF